MNYKLPNKYLEMIKNEPDKEKIFVILKKYFTDNICHKLYQQMDLLNADGLDIDQYKNTYITIANDLSLDILSAVETLVASKQQYELDWVKNNTHNNTHNNIFQFNQPNTQCEYSICQSYMNKIDK